MIMSFANGNINEEEKFNNIIYFDYNDDKYKGNIIQIVIYLNEKHLVLLFYVLI